MSISKIESSWKKTAYYTAPSSSSRKVHITRKRGGAHASQRKTSTEDLAEQGYTIGKHLGDGSYCKVKLAKYQDKELAVKIITRRELSNDFESRFLPREIDILSKIKHPNIIEVERIFSYPKRVFIFMELVRRGDLLAFIRGRGRLAESDARHFFRQIVDAIQYLHRLNIAHRDLKCENIMITENDEVKVIDFGFCRSTVNKKGRRELSSTYCGSTAYAAPEVLQGIPYNPMMYDVWSLGCVLFIMMTGTMPFDDSNVRRLVTCQLKRQFKYPSTFRVNKDITTLISHMLEPDVTRRATMTQTLISHMLEPDVTRRATMTQVSRNPWINEDDDDYEPGEYYEKEAPGLATYLKINNPGSVSKASQTMDRSESEELNFFTRKFFNK